MRRVSAARRLGGGARGTDVGAVISSRPGAEVFADQRPGVSGSTHPAYDLVDGRVRLAGQVFGDGDDGIQQGEFVVATGAGAAPLHPADRRSRAVLNRLVGAASGSPRQTLR
ncbi:hypothetical protein QFZ67_001511 [Streptomyces sp. V1I1]|nr:hypothetical protein [Streptomyces sp. V1I1]